MLVGERRVFPAPVHQVPCLNSLRTGVVEEETVLEKERMLASIPAVKTSATRSSVAEASPKEAVIFPKKVKNEFS